MELILDAGGYAIGIPPDIAELLRHGIRNGMEQKLDSVVRRRRSGDELRAVNHLRPD
jgi:hypothetical protein